MNNRLSDIEKNLYFIAGRLGIDPAILWDMSPGQLQSYIDGAEEAQQERLTALASVVETIANTVGALTTLTYNINSKSRKRFKPVEILKKLERSRRMNDETEKILKSVMNRRRKAVAK